MTGKGEKMDHRMVRTLTGCGILIALSIILTRFASFRIPIFGVENIRIGFGPFPIILGGILFGPILGFSIGAIADVIGFIISPMGTYMPHFTLVSGLNGLIPGLWMISSPKMINLTNSFRVRWILGVVTSQLLNQWLLLPWFLFLTFEIPIKLSLLPRLISAPIQALVYILFGVAIFSRQTIKTFLLSHR
jgi:ECF transporter S component (folate family)